MSSIIWIASYPRSGNTWTRAVLTNLLRPSNSPAPINSLLVLSAASRRLFDDCVGFQASELPRDELIGLRADLYEFLASQSSEPLLLKVHDVNADDADRRRLIPRKATRAAVYLVRNPLDVAISFAAYSGWSIDEAIDNMNQQSLTLCGSECRNTLRLPQRLGSWSTHVSSWVDERAFPVHVFRYEDLLASPLQTFGELIRIVSPTASAEQVRSAVEFSEFDVLRRQEEELDFDERPPRADVFFRSGQIDQWKTALSQRQADRIRSDHRGTMRRFGYA